MTRLRYATILAAVIIGLVAAAPSRSPEWRKVRAEHLAREPMCAVCGTDRWGDGIEVHHVVLFADKPELELNPGNMVTLCRYCHFRAGHLGVNWKTGNPEIRAIYGTVSNSCGYRVWQLRQAAK